MADPCTGRSRGASHYWLGDRRSPRTAARHEAFAARLRRRAFGGASGVCELGAAATRSQCRPARRGVFMGRRIASMDDREFCRLDRRVKTIPRLAYRGKDVARGVTLLDLKSARLA